MFKKIIFLFVILTISLSALKGQVGLNVHYLKSDYNGWNEVLKNQSFDDYDLFGQSFKIGVDYGFSLRYYRVSFFPEVTFLRSAYEINSLNGEYLTFDLMQIGFNFKTFVYPLDLLSKKSMQCPSFHRGMDKFTKGWFILFQPEIVYSSKELIDYHNSTGSYIPEEDAGLVFGFGIGTGLDIGISESFSITPSLLYSFVLGEKWEGFSQTFDQASFNDGTSVSYLSVGLRIGLWF